MFRGGHRRSALSPVSAAIWPLALHVWSMPEGKAERTLDFGAPSWWQPLGERVFSETAEGGSARRRERVGCAPGRLLDGSPWSSVGRDWRSDRLERLRTRRRGRGSTLQGRELRFARFPSRQATPDRVVGRHGTDIEWLWPGPGQPDTTATHDRVRGDPTAGRSPEAEPARSRSSRSPRPASPGSARCVRAAGSWTAGGRKPGCASGTRGALSGGSAARAAAQRVVVRHLGPRTLRGTGSWPPRRAHANLTFWPLGSRSESSSMGTRPQPPGRVQPGRAMARASTGPTGRSVSGPCRRTVPDRQGPGCSPRRSSGTSLAFDPRAGTCLPSATAIGLGSFRSTAAPPGGYRGSQTTRCSTPPGSRPVAVSWPRPSAMERARRPCASGTWRPGRSASSRSPSRRAHRNRPPSTAHGLRGGVFSLAFARRVDDLHRRPWRRAAVGPRRPGRTSS